VSETDQPEGLRERISSRGEEALGDLAQALLDNPLLNQALSAALGAGQRAVAAQQTAMRALDLPTGEDLKRLEKRLRAVSERIGELEDAVDSVADRVRRLESRGA
jgi:hypothetical protein